MSAGTALSEGSVLSADLSVSRAGASLSCPSKPFPRAPALPVSEAAKGMESHWTKLVETMLRQPHAKMPSVKTMQSARAAARGSLM